MSETKGILYGIGVGPGDPELVTVKAMKTIEKCDLLVLPAKEKETCKAYNIVREVYPEIENKVCICCPFPMNMSEDALHAYHKEVATNMKLVLDADKKVGFLVIGDPCLYSTFEYIRVILDEQGYTTKIISGVTSVSAVAAVADISLAQNNEQVHIIPGEIECWEEALSLPGTKVFMKAGKNLGILKELLLAYEKKNPPAEVYAVSDCGLPGERSMRGASQIDEEMGYFTVVIVK